MSDITIFRQYVKSLYSLLNAKQLPEPMTTRYQFNSQEYISAQLIQAEWHIMMKSSNGNIFRFTGHCAGIHRSPMNSTHKGRWRGALLLSFDMRLNKRLIKTIMVVASWDAIALIMTYLYLICVSTYGIIGSANDLTPARHLAIIWTNTLWF